MLADFDVEFWYIKGSDNSVADALSQKDIDDKPLAVEVKAVAALVETGPILAAPVKAGIIRNYATNSFYQALLSPLPLRDDCIIREGLLFIEGRLYIPTGDSLCSSLIDLTHTRLGHLGYLKTITKLRRGFFWPKMAQEVEQFVKSCKRCQKIKSSTQAPTGKMLTPSIPTLPLAHLAIDFVGPLPRVNNYDMILTCTCRLTGFTRLIPTSQTYTGEQVASRFFTGWIGSLGPPASIISDRDKLWTLSFWKALMKRTGTSFHMTTAFHPQADGRSEQTNRTVGQILRTFTAKRQGKWLEALPAVEFAINGVINVLTGKSPLELILGRAPRLFTAASEESGIPSLEKWLTLRKDTWETAHDALWSSRVQQALHHNQRCKSLEPMEPDSWALLDLLDWRGKHTGGTNKLRDNSEGPYRVIATSNHGQNVHLELPDGDRRHPTFHVLKVKPFVERTCETEEARGLHQQK